MIGPTSRVLTALAITALVAANGCTSLPAVFGCKAETLPANAAVPDSFLVALETNRGRADIMVRSAWSRLGAKRFLDLVDAHFFDGARFFRVVKGQFAQFGISGDPAVTKTWKSRCIADEPVKHTNSRGTISFAQSGPDSRSTQLFVNLSNNARLDGPKEGYPPIGEIVSGMGVVDSLYAGYGEFSPKSGPQPGAEGPRPDSILLQGNAYLARGWPQLDYITSARVVGEWPARRPAGAAK